MYVRMLAWSAMLAVLAVGCGGRTSTSVPAAPSSNAETVSVQFQILIPASTAAQARKPAYVSAATKSASVSVSPGNTTTIINCTTTACSGSVLAPLGGDTFTVNLYDGSNATGNLLSTGTLTQTIVIDQANSVSVTFNGVVASLSVALSPRSVIVGTPATIAVTANALDADGNTIIGPGSYSSASGGALTVNLADSDGSGATHLSQSSLSAPTSGITLSYNGASIPNPTISATASGLTSARAILTANAAVIAFTGSPVTISPNAAPLATTSPFPFSGALQIQAKDANGNIIAGAFSPVTVANGDTSGNTCLRYLALGAAATPCPFSSAGQSVTVKNSTDQIVVQYNNAPMSVAGFMLSAAQPAPAATPATVTATVNTQAVSFLGLNPATVPKAVLPFGTNVYAAAGAAGSGPNAALLKYSFAAGTIAAAPGVPTTATTGIGQIHGALGSAGNNLTQPIVGLTVGPDNNIWFVEAAAGVMYVGVYAVSGPASGGAVASGAVGESTNLYSANGTIGNGSALSAAQTMVGITSMGGYIWVLDSGNDVVRIDPTNLQNAGGTGIIKAISGVGNDPPFSSPWNGGVIASGGSLYAATSNGSVTKTSPSTVAATTQASLLYATSGSPATYTQTSPSGFVNMNGVLNASDGNFWSAAGGAATALIFVNPAATTTGQLAQANNLEGSLAQGGPDNFLFTTTSAAATGLYYTNTAGTTTGLVITTAAGCVPAAGATGVSPTGAALAFMPGGYIVQVTPNAANVCVAIP